MQQGEYAGVSITGNWSMLREELFRYSSGPGPPNYRCEKRCHKAARRGS